MSIYVGTTNVKPYLGGVEVAVYIGSTQIHSPISFSGVQLLDQSLRIIPGRFSSPWSNGQSITQRLTVLQHTISSPTLRRRVLVSVGDDDIVELQTTSLATAQNIGSPPVTFSYSYRRSFDGRSFQRTGSFGAYTMVMSGSDLQIHNTQITRGESNQGAIVSPSFNPASLRIQVYTDN